MDRLYGLYWVIQYEDDVNADMLHVFGVDMYSYEYGSARLFGLFYRLMVYSGETSLKYALAQEEEATKPKPKEELKQMSLDSFLQMRAELKGQEER